MRRQLVIPRRHIRFWLWALALVGAVVGTAFLSRIPALAYQTRLSLTEMPERTTELYFDRPADLPTRVSPGQIVTVWYHITNDEGVATRYEANVSVDEGGHNTEVEKKTFVLPNGAATDIPVSFTASTQGAKYELTVSLPRQREQIRFWCAS